MRSGETPGHCRHHGNALKISHTIEFAPDAGIGPTLLCPRCGSHEMHQGRVTVFDRDDDAELIISVSGTGRSALP